MSEPLSFAAAIAHTGRLLDRQAAGELSLEDLATEVAALVTTTDGARGFFVAWLSGDWPLADAPPAPVLAALATAPEPVASLLVRNLAMSTAMIRHHREQGDEEAAAGSQRTARRSAALIAALNLPELHLHLAEMQNSLNEPQGEYAAFLQRWGYTEAQKDDIRQALIGIAAERN